MTKTHKINANMYTILVTNQMDKFTVTEASNNLISSTEEFLELNNVRKSLYQQLYKFEQKGWLSSSGKGRTKRYSVTEDFKNLCVTQNKLSSPLENSPHLRGNKVPACEVATIQNEKRAAEAELEVTLCEITRYKQLEESFPKLVKIVSPLTQKAHERSVELLGNLNALSNVLNSLYEMQKQR
ncbi:hypothetical protein [Vibrio parahaemolyticus]|uniref:hypothetical protein n=1 Tax=Vibrio parahaemolyticus TaxID=670 RepID=UPI002B1EEBCE|nr:hypothetical protein [Vibrio parahaemolyticus]